MKKLIFLLILTSFLLISCSGNKQTNKPERCFKYELGRN